MNNISKIDKKLYERIINSYKFILKINKITII